MGRTCSSDDPDPNKNPRLIWGERGLTYKGDRVCSLQVTQAGCGWQIGKKSWGDGKVIRNLRGGRLEEEG